MLSYHYYRQRIIKKAIKTIIKNLVADRCRLLFKVVSDGTNADISDYKHLFKLSKKDFEHEMKNPKYGEVDRMHYMMATDPAKMGHVREVEKDLKEFKNKFQDLVHDIIRMKNRILKTQNDFKEIDKPEKAGCDVKNIAKFIKYAKEMESKPEYSIWNVWNIKRADMNTADSIQPVSRMDVSADTYDVVLSDSSNQLN